MAARSCPSRAESAGNRTPHSGKAGISRTAPVAFPQPGKCPLTVTQIVVLSGETAIPFSRALSSSLPSVRCSLRIAYDRPILPHSDDCVVAAVSDVEVRLDFESRIARPVWIVCLNVGWRQIDWLVQRVRMNSMHRRHSKNRTIIGELNYRDRVREGFAD